MEDSFVASASVPALLGEIERLRREVLSRNERLIEAELANNRLRQGIMAAARPDTSEMSKREADAVNTQWLIRDFFMTNIGATRSECASALGISRRTVWKHLERMKSLESGRATLADATPNTPKDPS